MAKTNQIIESKTSGGKAKFLVTTEDFKGALLKAQVWIQPGAVGPPEHHHPVQRESFEGSKGQLNLIHKREEMVLRHGENFMVAPNVLHKWSNPGSEELVAIVELRPALKTEYILEGIYALDQKGKLNKNGLPNPLQFAAILHECYGELFVIGFPVFIQKVMAITVGRLANWLGFKTYIPFPHLS